MRTCTKCGGDNTTETQSWCSTCKREYDKAYYANESNRRSHIQNVSKNNKKYKITAQEFIIKYLKEHSCVDCGESDIVVLEFDHRYNKKHNISRMISNGLSLNAIQEEIRKCDVRCSNCHIKKTAKQFKWYKLNMAH